MTERNKFMPIIDDSPKTYEEVSKIMDDLMAQESDMDDFADDKEKKKLAI